MGIGWAKRDLMARPSEENSGRGREGNDVLSATEGNSERRGRGSGGMCDWGQGRAISRSG